MSNTPDPRAAALRAAGHAEAAEMLDKLHAGDHQEPAAEPIPEWERQAQQERAAGQAMLDELKRQIPGRFPAPTDEAA